MMDHALEEIDDERWLWGVNGWVYADTIYHLIITQEFYIRDKPQGMRWGSLYGDKELMESNLPEYYPTREVLMDYKETIEGNIEDYLCTVVDSDLLDTDGFSEYLPTIHEKLLYMVRHNAHHIGELALMHRELDLGRIKWI
jgi:uncharacterized damage-inducible protein DinB